MEKPHTKIDPVKAVNSYRRAVALRDRQTTRRGKTEAEANVCRLRQEWQECQGEDSLHEMAFGEPVE